jgi:uncharacterized protein involved in oxidation of intracellular sulfur
MKILIIINDAPYGSERMYNALRLAGALAKHEGAEIKVFLIGDAVSGAHRGQKVPQGYYNVQTMLSAIIRRNASLGVCGSCMDARGMTDIELIEGTHRSSVEELTAWTLQADKVITF